MASSSLPVSSTFYRLLTPSRHLGTSFLYRRKSESVHPSELLQFRFVVSCLRPPASSALHRQAFDCFDFAPTHADHRQGKSDFDLILCISSSKPVSIPATFCNSDLLCDFTIRALTLRTAPSSRVQISFRDSALPAFHPSEQRFPTDEVGDSRVVLEVYCNGKPIINVPWAKAGRALIYFCTKKPCRIYYSMLGSKDEDVILLEEPAQNLHVNIRHTKNFKFVTVNVFSTTISKVTAFAVLAKVLRCKADV
ncbi:hypothetical protein LXL04_032459 [Taraxacum kok-saghyz]